MERQNTHIHGRGRTVKASRTTLVAGVMLLLVAMTILPVAANTILESVFFGLGGDQGLGTFDLVSSAALNGNVWTYSYTLAYLTNTGGIAAHQFSLDNRPTSQFSDAWNDYNWTNPDFSVSPEVKWLGDNLDLNPGTVAHFSYTSIYGPATGRMKVFAHVVDGGDSASGPSVGMGSIFIPEPSGFAGLIIGLSAIAPFIKRRRK